MIPYSCYDKIEEVDEQVKASVAISRLPPRHGTLPSPGYSGLIRDEPKPPIAKDIATESDETLSACLKIIDNFLESNADNIAVETVQKEDFNEKRKPRPNSYVELVSESDNGTPEDNDEIPAYLKLTDDSLQ